jgi:hypothetical protein
MYAWKGQFKVFRDLMDLCYCEFLKVAFHSLDAAREWANGRRPSLDLYAQTSKILE